MRPDPHCLLGPRPVRDARSQRIAWLWFNTDRCREYNAGTRLSRVSEMRPDCRPISAASGGDRPVKRERWILSTRVQVPRTVPSQGWQAPRFARSVQYWADLAIFSRFYWQARWVPTTLSGCLKWNTFGWPRRTAARWGHFYWTSGHVHLNKKRPQPRG